MQNDKRSFLEDFLAVRVFVAVAASSSRPMPGSATIIPASAPGGYCHLIARVEIIGGRTGLLSNTLSKSSITAADNLGTIYFK